MCICAVCLHACIIFVCLCLCVYLYVYLCLFTCVCVVCMCVCVILKELTEQNYNEKMMNEKLSQLMLDKIL